MILFRDKLKMEINRREHPLALNRFVRTDRNNAGFTMVELIMVMAIIGVLAAISMIAISDFKNKTKTARAATEIRGLEKDIIAYATDKGTYPPDLAAIGMAGLKDPWNGNYVYTPAPPATAPPAPPASHPRYVTADIDTPPLNTDFYLYSKGPNGRSDPWIGSDDSLDDLIRANDGSYVGTAEQFL
jgi:general secretion pathway protein G